MWPALNYVRGLIGLVSWFQSGSNHVIRILKLKRLLRSNSPNPVDTLTTSISVLHDAYSAFCKCLDASCVCLCDLKAAESIQAEDESAKLCKRRIEHLKEHSSDQLASVNLWKKKRMDRMMVEHLLRCGYYNTAVKLARQSGIEVTDL